MNVMLPGYSEPVDLGALEVAKGWSAGVSSPWISVKDMMPVDWVACLVFEEGYEAPCVARYRHDERRWYEMVVGLALDGNVTHWMQLPPNPVPNRGGAG